VEGKAHQNVMMFQSIRRATAEYFGDVRGKGGKKGMHMSAAMLAYMLMPAAERQQVLNKMHAAISLAEGGSGDVFENAKKIWGEAQGRPSEKEPEQVATHRR